MKRRKFAQLIGVTAISMGSSSFRFLKDKNPMNRIGMSTVNFRERFVNTRSKDSSFSGSDMNLMEIPVYFADRFKLHNVEFWSKHFESIDAAYLKELRDVIKKQKSRLRESLALTSWLP